MNVIYALIVLQAAATNHQAWQVVAQFEHKLALVAQFRCEVAAEQLNLTPQHYHCVQTK